MTKIGQDYSEDKTKPAVCCVAITKGCMFQCKMCYLWKENKPQKDHLDVDIICWKRFIESLSIFAGKTPRINFVGGESLTSDAALPLIKYASALGCETSLSSNAYLIDEDMSKNIASSGLNEIILSLDSIDQETHDSLRGVKGSFQRIIRAIDYLAKNAENVRININTVITQMNLEGIVDLAHWCIRDSRIESVNFLAVTQPFDTKQDDNWYRNNKFNFLWPKESEKLDSIIDVLIKLKEENMRKVVNLVSQFRVYKSYYRNPHDYFKQTGCDIYKRVLNVSSNGQISMCLDMEAIGNIKQDDFDIRKLWNSSLAAEVRNKIKSCGKNCHFRVNCLAD